MELDLDEIQRELERYRFSEVRILESRSDSITLENGKVKDIDSHSGFVMGFRVLIKGSFGFATTRNPSRWREALENAVKLAKVNPRPMKSRLSDEDVYEDTWVVKPRKSGDIEEKVDLLIELYRSLKIPRKVKMVELDFHDSRVRSVYMNSDGSRIIQRYPKSTLVLTATAREDFVISAREAVGGLYGLEIFKKVEKFQDAVYRARDLLKSKRAKPGRHKAIIDPEMAGVFAHEAIGHACEADGVVNDTSILKDKLGQRIGSDLVTIVDDATIPRAYGSYGYDDEGIPGQRTVLVENGILKGFMHSRETASELGTKSTGNARAQSPAHFPLVRMSNTFFESGDSTLEEMMENMRSGIIIHGMRGGVTDPNSGYFQFAAEYGELVEDGETTGLLRDITISGNFLHILHNIDMVGKDLYVTGIGTCGKSGQGVRVGDGGPYLSVREVLLG